MAIDLLGKEQPKKVKKPEKIIYHQPDKEKEPVKPVLPPKVTAKKPKPVIIEKKEEVGEVNLITSFKKYLLKKRIISGLILAIVILAIISISIFIATRPPKIVININQPANSNINKLLTSVCGNKIIEVGEECDENGCGPNQACINCSCQAIIPVQPVCGNGIIEKGEQCDQSACSVNQACVNCLCQTITPPAPFCGNAIIETGEECDLLGCGTNQTCFNCRCQEISLPDTELTPLRGALVRFKDNSDVYLVEWHGELRRIDQQTVIFKSGKTIKLLAANNQIYLINSIFKDTRQGKEVKGYVDWDPRILSNEEIEPFK